MQKGKAERETTMLKYIKQIAIILTICLIAEILEYVIPLPVAASIYGLVLMLVVLITGIIPLSEVEDTANLLTENIAILFIPPTVGLMASVDVMKQMLVPLLVISCVSTWIIMAVTGWVSQGIIRRSKKKNEADSDRQHGKRTE